jgi:hypothetical protein
LAHVVHLKGNNDAIINEKGDPLKWRRRVARLDLAELFKYSPSLLWRDAVFILTLDHVESCPKVNVRF